MKVYPKQFWAVIQRNSRNEWIVLHTASATKAGAKRAWIEAINPSFMPDRMFAQGVKSGRLRVGRITLDAPTLPEALKDPVAVHANMLRGCIAKPTPEAIIHLYGAEVMRAALARITGEAKG